MWGLISRLQSIMSPTVHRKSELNLFSEYQQIYSNPSDLYLVNRFEKNVHTLKLFYSQKFSSDLLWTVVHVHSYERTHTHQYEANIHTHAELEREKKLKSERRHNNNNKKEAGAFLDSPCGAVKRGGCIPRQPLRCCKKLRLVVVLVVRINTL